MTEQAKKRIIKEYERLSENIISNCGVTVGLIDENSIFEWTATLLGPKDTSYKNGIFILNIKFPKDYPNQGPEICFKTPIYHINVNPYISEYPGKESLGHICLSTLNWWKPEYTMAEVLTNIFALFYLCNPESPYGLDRANEFKFNRALYEAKCKYFTKKYANPKFADIEKEYNESWDFSCNDKDLEKYL